MEQNKITMERTLSILTKKLKSQRKINKLLDRTHFIVQLIIVVFCIIFMIKSINGEIESNIFNSMFVLSAPFIHNLAYKAASKETFDNIQSLVIKCKNIEIQLRDLE